MQGHAQDLLDSKVPALLMGDFNIIPTDEDVYKPERWLKDALFAPEAKEKYRELVGQGWTDGIPQMSVGDTYRFWIPDELAYKGQEGKPQGMLVFDVELLETTPAAAFDPRGDVHGH